MNSVLRDDAVVITSEEERKATWRALVLELLGKMDKLLEKHKGELDEGFVKDQAKEIATYSKYIEHVHAPTPPSAPRERQGRRHEDSK